MEKERAERLRTHLADYSELRQQTVEILGENLTVELENAAKRDLGVRSEELRALGGLHRLRTNE